MLLIYDGASAGSINAARPPGRIGGRRVRDATERLHHD
jgi:hypothetical protein